MFFRLSIVLVTVAVLSEMSVAGEVALPNGKVIWGEVSLAEAGTVTVKPGQAVAETFPLDAVSRIDLSPTPSPDDGGKALGVPWPWKAGDFGAVRMPGAVVADEGAIAVTAAGWGLWSGVDSGHMVYQRLEGDGQLIARVRLPETARSSASGGVIIRESLAPEARFAAAIIGPKDAARMRARPALPATNPPAAEPDAQAARPTSGWVRIARSGNQFTGYRSADGTSWEEIGTQQIEMGKSVVVGLVTSSAVNMTTEIVRYDHVALVRGDPLNTAAASPTPARGIVLADGSTIAGLVTELDAQTLTWTVAGGAAQSAKLADVSWILFQPTHPRLTLPAGEATMGALLRSGDFAAGESVALDEGKVTVTSSLFGPKTFDLAKEVSAIALRAPARWEDAWHVRDNTGNVVSGANIKVEKEFVLVGDRRVKLADVREIYAPARK